MSKPQIGIIMGSDSDWKIMKRAKEILTQFNIEAEEKVVSAHRTPEDLKPYVDEAKLKGIQVIIAGAGGAAHLPGMIASYTSLPVIGVPINITALSGLDSLLSIVQMPKGVPVATVAIDNAENAGWLALRILSLQNQELEKKLQDWRAESVKASREKTKNLVRE